MHRLPFDSLEDGQSLGRVPAVVVRGAKIFDHEVVDLKDEKQTRVFE